MEQEELVDDVNPIRGQLPLLASLMGCPPVRLRMAIPEELITGPPGASPKFLSRT